MKVLLHFPQWGNRWIPYVIKELSNYDLTMTYTMDGEELGDLSEKADVLISMWCNDVVAFWSHYFKDKKIVSYLRRYEIWEDITPINFDAVDALIFVSEFYQKIFKSFSVKNGNPKRTYVIPNGVDINEFPFSAKRNGTKIAIVGSIKNVKNLPLAAQIMLKLMPHTTWSMHHVGIPFTSQYTGQVMSYFKNLGLERRFHFEQFVNSHKMPKWYSDKSIILSTSLNEGNPNCVIEAMAMGIKPVIHNWPGAKDQFPESVIFNTVDEAVDMIESGESDPEFYRQWIIDHYSIDNFKKLHTVIAEVCDAN